MTVGLAEGVCVEEMVGKMVGEIVKLKEGEGEGVTENTMTTRVAEGETVLEGVLVGVPVLVAVPVTGGVPLGD